VGLLDLSGRGALVVGAGKGIGRATAQLLGAAGAHTVVLDRHRERLFDRARRVDRLDFAQLDRNLRGTYGVFLDCINLQHRLARATEQAPVAAIRRCPHHGSQRSGWIRRGEYDVGPLGRSDKHTRQLL